MAAMQRLYDDYEGRGFVLLPINCRDSDAIDPVAFVREAGYDYRVLPGGGRAARDYSVRGIPAIFVLDPEGRLLYQTSGFGADTERRLRALIGPHLK